MSLDDAEGPGAAGGDSAAANPTRAALVEFVAVIGETIDVLTLQRAGLLEMFRQIDEGADIRNVATSIGLSDQRLALTTALDRLEAARRQARLMVFRRLQEEGCSIGEVARIFGVSRQLASRILRNGG